MLFFVAVFSSKDDVTIAEILWTLKSCVSNFSFASNEGNNDLFKKMFPDSKIAANYRMSYTKCQYIVEYALKPFILKLLREDFENVPFTFKFDETTTVQVKKQFDGYIQYYSEKFQRIVNHFCGSLFLGHCTAQQMLDHFFQFGEKLKWNLRNLLHLGMDGPYLNKKFQRELEAELKSVHGKSILDISTCPLHPIHNSLEKGLASISFDYDKFARNLHTFFKRSAARREDYSIANVDSELEIHFMRKHVSSRWVSLKKAYQRISEQWEHLQNYFLVFLPKQKNFSNDIESMEAYQFIATTLKKPETPIFVDFVVYLAGILESYLIPMESKQPKVHLMYTKMGELFYKLMSCFVKRSRLLDDKGRKLEARELGKLDVTKHLKDIHSVELGTKVKYLVANIEQKINLDQHKLQLRACFIGVTVYLQKHLPHDSIFLKDLTSLQPDNRKRSSSAPAIRRVALKIANVLSNTRLTPLTPERYADEVMSQFNIYQSDTFEMPNTDPDKPLSIEDYWNFIGKLPDSEGKLKYKELLKLVRTCLSISHGNADPERGFSENKAILDGRECLGEETIVAIRLIKQSVALYGGVLKFPITRELINLFEGAKKAYEENQNLKKAESALKLATKRKLDESASGVAGANLNENLIDIEKLISAEKCKIEASNTVLQNGQSALEKALSNKQVIKDNVVKANALIKIGLENSKVSQNKPAELVSRKEEILEKMRKRPKV